MSCAWRLLSEVEPVASDFVVRTVNNNPKPAIEIQRANGRRSYVLLNDGVFGLPNSTVAWRPACPDFTGPVYNLDIVRWHVLETVAGTESALANYDYSTESSANAYIATFGGTRDLRSASFVETSDPSGAPLVTYAVVEENEITGEESILEVKTTLVGAQGYVSVFGATKILRIATMVEADLMSI